jgi:hypothetical protein
MKARCALTALLLGTLVLPAAAPAQAVTSAHDSAAAAPPVMPAMPPGHGGASPGGAKLPAGHPKFGDGGVEAGPKHPATGSAMGPMAPMPSRLTAKARAAAAALPLKSVSFVMYHRVFPDFRDHATVGLKQAFQIGDGEYTASVIEWVPDFAIDIKSHRISSRSAEPNNPAFHVVVKRKGVPQDTTWAFMHMAPHFARRSMIAFQVARIDIAGRPPLVPDSTKSLPAGTGAGR